MSNHDETIDHLKAALRSARGSRRDYQDVLQALRDCQDDTEPPDPEPPDPPRPEPPRPVPPPSGGGLEPPPTPDIPQAHRMEVGQGVNINEAVRAYYESATVGADEWIDVLVHGDGHGGLNLGGKYKVHNGGKPLNLYVRCESPGSALLDGHKIENYGGTYVAGHVCQGLDVRKAKYERAAVSDTGASGQLWYLDMRPMQNVAEALAGINYMGGKWGFKPSDGQEDLVIMGTRYGQDDEIGRLTRWWEHPLYETGARRIYVIGNELRGGNRTPGQFNTPRAGTWPQVSPEVVVIRGNYMETGSQWDHNDGGSLIVWESNGIVVIEDNDITSRYGGIKIGHQPEDADQYDDWPTPHNFQVSTEGHVHRKAIVRNNAVRITEGSRTGIGVDSCLDALVEGNTVIHEGGGPEFIIDGGFAAKRGAPRCKKVVHDFANPMTYDRVNGGYVPYTGPDQ